MIQTATNATNVPASAYVLLLSLLSIAVVGSLVVIRKRYARAVRRLMGSSAVRVEAATATEPEATPGSIDIPVVPLPSGQPAPGDSLLDLGRRWSRRTAVVVGCLIAVALAQAVILLALVEPGPVSLLAIGVATAIYATPSVLGWLLARSVARGRPTELGIWAGLALGVLSAGAVFTAIGAFGEVRAWLWLLSLLLGFAAAYVVLLASAVVLRTAQRVARLSPDAIAATLACLGATAFWTLNPVLSDGNTRAWAYVVPGIAFPGLLVLAATLFGLIQRSPATVGATTPQRLLFLRTFGHAKRSDRLLRGVSRLWLEGGAMDLVAGPDLAASVVTLDKLVAWLTGTLRGKFIANGADIAHMIHSEAERPYRDGRYPVREFSCFESGWREAVIELASRAGVVLMDLRSFTPDNAGCVFEIRTLIESGIAGRAVFLVDGTTKVEALQAVLADARGRSEGARSRAVPRLYEMPADDKAHFRAVVATALAHTASFS